MSTIESLELQIRSNSASATSGIETLIQTLSRLKGVTKDVGLKVVVKDMDNTSKSSKKLKDNNKLTTKSFTDIYNATRTTVYALSRVADVIGSLINKSADYVENVNLFTVSMGDFASSAYDYANEVGEAMGIDPGEWMRNQGVFMTLATGFGVASDRAATMSENLTQLGYDISSFFNLSYEDAMQKLQSGLSGELEPLRRIGYDLSQAKLEAVALSLGIKKSITDMTQAEKAQLRYYAIMTQVTTAQGDMARTINDPANQMRIFKTQVEIAGREIGNTFIPALQAVIPYATAVFKTIAALGSVIAALVGYQEEVIDTTGIEPIVGGAEEISDAFDEGTKSVKKFKSQAMGIDELNVFNSDDDSASSELSDAFDFELPEYDFTKGLVDSQINEITEKMKEWLGLTEDITSWSDLLATNFGNILVSIGLIVVGIAGVKIASLVSDTAKLTKMVVGLKNAGEGFLLFIRTIGAAAVIAGAVVGAGWLIKNTESTITKIGAIVSAGALVVGAILAFTGINIPLGIGLMAVGAFSMGTAIVMNSKLDEDIKGLIAALTAILSVSLLALGAVLAFSGGNIPLGLALMAGGALTLATAILPNWNTLSESMRTVISVFSAILGGAMLVVGAILAFSGLNIPLGIALMAAGAISLATPIVANWDAITEAIRGPVGAIMAILGGALLVIGALLLFTGVGIPLGIALMAAGGASLGTAIAVNWDFLTDKISEIWENIKTLWNTHIAPIFTREWWLNLGKTCVNGLIAGYEMGINAIISMFENMINWIVDGLNSISFDVPDWVPLIGGKTFGFNIARVSFGRVTLPRFEDGGFPATGQLFVAREAGAEMVGSIGRRTAVANNDQIVAGIAGGVAEANEEQNMLLREQNSLLRAILEKDNSTYLDGRSLTNSVERYQRERGRVLVRGGAV